MGWDHVAQAGSVDGRDNDGDGLVDCLDGDCETASCGLGCTCTGHAAHETTCSDGLDNDLDDVIDCAGRTCAFGKTCPAVWAARKVCPP